MKDVENVTRFRKLWPRVLLAIASPVAFFCLSEGVLAIAGVKPLALTEDPYFGFASGQPLFLKKNGPGGTEVFETNPVKLTHFNFQTFPAQKAPGTFRIFALGGSTTYGHPWRDSTSFSAWLRELLTEADTARRYEVVNAGGISYASYRAARLAEELIRYEPDLFLVYNGHNEFLEERTYRATREIPAWVRDLSGLLDRTRTYSLMRRMADKARPRRAGAPAKLSAEVDDVLARTIGPRSYARDDALRARVLQHYEESEKRIALLAKAAGAKVIYLTTPSNEKDCSPFKSEPTPGLGGEDALRAAAWLRAGEALLETDPEAALAPLDSAVALDPRNAAAQYAAGRAALASGKVPEARARFRRAIDEDVCPLRALAPMREIERRVARETGAGFVDFEDTLRAAVRARDGVGILGAPDFTDHVHLTVEHYGLLARGILSEMRRMGLVSPGALDDAAKARVRARILARLDAAEEGLGYHNIAKVLNWAGKTADAARAALRGLEKDTVSLESVWSSLFVGADFERRGQTVRALPHYRRALRLDSTNAESWRLLGEALVRLGDTAGGEAGLEEAALRDPGNLPLRERAGRLAYARGRYDAAVHHLRAVTLRAPENTGLRVLLAGSLLGMNRPAEAEKELRAVLRATPDEAGAWMGLGYLFERRGDVQGAVQHYARAAQLNPGLAPAQNALGRLLGGMR